MATVQDKRVIAITGASGVVGRDLVHRFQQTHRVLALARTPFVCPGVEFVSCDLARPKLGLDERAWCALADRIDVVIHSAAVTTWGLPRESYTPVNIEGTRAVIELARAAGAPLHLISSCFVRALESPRCDDILSPGNVVHPYIWSKRQSERLVEHSGVPYNIYRPTNLVGHSATGASSRAQIVQMLSDWIARGKAPYFPAHAGNLVDVAPVDMVSCAVAGALDTGALGQEYWITYGAASMTVDETLAVIIDHAGRLGRSVPKAPIVDPRQNPPLAMAQVPAMSRSFLKVLIDVSEVTHACGGVLPTSIDLLRDRYNASAIGCAEAFRQTLQYSMAHRQAD